MAFRQISGEVQVKWYPKKASTVIAVGNLMYADGSGAITNATTTSDYHMGISLKAVAATDSDYASTTLIPVLVPHDTAEFLVDVGTGTATSALIGTYVDLAAAGTADVSASAVDALFVTGVESSSLIRVIVNDMASYRSPA